MYSNTYEQYITPLKGSIDAAFAGYELRPKLSRTHSEPVYTKQKDIFGIHNLDSGFVSENYSDIGSEVSLECRCSETDYEPRLDYVSYTLGCEEDGGESEYGEVFPPTIEVLKQRVRALPKLNIRSAGFAVPKVATSQTRGPGGERRGEERILSDPSGMNNYETVISIDSYSGYPTKEIYSNMKYWIMLLLFQLYGWMIIVRYMEGTVTPAVPFE